MGFLEFSIITPKKKKKEEMNFDFNGLYRPNKSYRKQH